MKIFSKKTLNKAKNKATTGTFALILTILALSPSVALARRDPFIPYKTPVMVVMPRVYNFPNLTAPLEWRTVYDGYGTVNWDVNLQQITMSPKPATQPTETHAALVVSKSSYHQPFQLNYTMKTTKQLRVGSTPNAWEVGWLVFGYKTDGKFKYLILKPNGYGLELGESLLNDKQNFLYTSAFNQDLFPVNKDYNVTIIAQNNIITITINGKQYAPYSLTNKDALTVDGQYGFYTEDAAVQVSNIKMEQF